MRRGIAEWIVTDAFYKKWRLWIVPISERPVDIVRVAQSDQPGNPLFHLIYAGFTHSRALCDDLASDLLSIYDVLTGTRLSEMLPRPTRDPQRRLRGFEPELRRVLYSALEWGVLKWEPYEVPWPFPEVEEQKEQGKEAPREQQDWIRILLLDSAGEPIPSELDAWSVTADVTLSGGKEYSKIPFSGGRADVAAIPPGSPSACTVAFFGFHDGADAVPTKAAPATLVTAETIDKGLVRTPVEGPRWVTRRELRQTQRVSLGCTNTFQLRRRQAEVIEVEHFAEDGVLVWPGDAPEDVIFREGAPRIRGIEALRDGLTLAQGVAASRIRVIGHGAKLSQERANGVLALLVGDDDAQKKWVDLALANGVVKDQQAILQWVAIEFGWACDPGKIDGERGEKTDRAITAFQRAYNAEVEAGAFPRRSEKLATNGKVEAKTWGAMFDCYARALHTPKAGPRETAAYIVVDDQHETSPAKLAKIAAPGNDEKKWRALNPLNPSMVRPAGRGWYPPQVGQRIYIPDDWDLDALVDDGYKTQDAETAPAATPVEAIAAPGPKVIDCGAHHLKTPFAEKRRAVERRVEVVFFPEGDEPETICTADSAEPCTAKTCELYDPREYTLMYPPEGFSIYLDAEIGKGGTELRYVLSTADGSYRQEHSGADATPAGASRHKVTFTDLTPGASYSLDKILSETDSIRIFENVAYNDLFAVPEPAPPQLRRFRAALGRFAKNKKKKPT